ncbi:MAG: glycosyltransferase family 2 protein [Actinomycetota bacterium]|nr:glycosyltransferase family 2 protein [Actinomycetota bacterium]
MPALRIFGGLFAIFLLVSALIRYRRHQISRLNVIISWFIGLGLTLLAGRPSIFNGLFDAFNFQPGNGRRLTAVSMVASVVLLFLLLRNQYYTDANERGLRLLVESLGQQAFDWAATDRLPPGERIVVVSPAYNEAENVAGVIREIPEEVEGYRVVTVVIDDASEDATSEVARAAGALVARLPIRRGGGLALRVGYEIALKLGADIVVSLDADGQHLPEELPGLVKPVVADEADMVNGSRLLGVFERESLVRHVGVHFFSWVVTVLTGQRVTDISSGYRATRAATLRKLVLEQDQFWTSEVLIEALRQRARITEVPITIRARRGGKSKKPKSLKYGWHFTKAIMQTWLR